MAGKPGQKSLRAVDLRGDTSLEALDQRLEAVKVMRERLGQLVTHLGGAREVSYPEESLCRRAVHLEKWLECQEDCLRHNTPVDVAVWLNAINTLSALFSKIGLRRRAKVIGSLAERLAAPAKESHVN